ncbi:MAG: hypothetical protein CVU65_14300 [Deltaproteobacteria bacterium HGW-Deltaproteobacteria-22]|nr:MAG: hypothetical protein CVU65_14300 [Deltaproteobacteria bacterium HGW-Deltaproteobacteria-22]
MVGLTNKKAVRLLRLQERLIMGKEVYPPDLARELHVSLRSVQRDLADLQKTDLALRTHETPDGRQVWSVMPSQRQFDVKMTTMDLVVARLALGMFHKYQGTGLEDFLAELAEKVSSKLESAAGSKKLNLTGRLMARQPFSRDFTTSSDIFDEVLTALLNGKKLEMDYAGLRGETRRHIVHPYTLLAYKSGLYLIGRSESVRDGLPRVFAIERISACVHLRKEPSEVPPDWDPEAFVPFWGGLLPGKEQKVRLRFVPTLAPYVQKLRLPENSRLTRGPAGSLDLTLHAVINEEFITWVLGFGPAVQVITPRRLQEQMCDQLRATLAQYETA